MTREASSLPRQVTGFLLIGAAGTAAYLLAFLVLRTAMPAQPANVIARVAVAVPTTWLNGRYTFRTSLSRRRLTTGAVAVLVAGTALSSGLLLVEHALLGSADRLAELVALVVANAVATLGRFALMRQWLFGPTRSTTSSTALLTADPQQPQSSPPVPAGRTVQDSTILPPGLAVTRAPAPL